MSAVMENKPRNSGKVKVRLRPAEKKRFLELQSKLNQSSSVIEIETYEQQMMNIINKAILRKENEKKQKS